jgi:hypothetical protein
MILPQVILIPGLVAESCLLLNDTLTHTRLSNCSNISLRAYGAFDHGYDFEAGANILNMAKTGLDQSLLVSNVSLLSDAYRRVHDTIAVQENISIMADGVGIPEVLVYSISERVSFIDPVGRLLQSAPRVALQWKLWERLVRTHFRFLCTCSELYA